MRFPPIAYLEFARRRLDLQPPAFDLASSSLEPPPPSALGLGLADAAPLPIAGANPYGHPRYRRLLAERYGVPPERVLCTLGTSLANFLLAAAVLQGGELVLCERPAYEPLPRMLEGLGARLLEVPRPAERGFQPDLDAIRLGLSLGARLVVLTDLHNPSAARLEPELRARIVRLAAAHDAWVLFDEVYLSGVPESMEDPAALSAARLGEPRVLVTASLSKTYGLGALRAGWAIAPPELVERAHAIQAHLGGEAPYVSEELAARALERLPVLAARARERRAACLPLVRAFARAHGLGWHEPAGGFIAWVRLPAGLASAPLAERLRARYDTQLIPGDFFDAPGYLRLGFGRPPEQVAEGLRRLGGLLEEQDEEQQQQQQQQQRGGEAEKAGTATA